MSKTIAIALVLTSLMGAIAGCRPAKRGEERLAEDSANAQKIQSDLTFKNITLEQANEQGQTLWKVHADQATYSQDKELAQITNPNGELFQDGKAIFHIQAQKGEVRQNGQTISMQGQIVATDKRSGAVLRGDRLTWDPKQGLLVVRNNLRGDHPQVKLVANEGRMYTREQRLELTGQVTAISNDPDLRMQAEHITWTMKDNRLVSTGFTQVDRLKNNRVTDTAKGNQAEFNLKTKIATLTQNAQLVLTDPPVQISSNSIVWDIKGQTAVSNQPLTVVHQQQQVRLTANQGRLNLEQRIFYLTSNVHAIAQRNQSQLTSDRLTWTIPSQSFVAEGNVNYRQVNPVTTVRGPRAVGKLSNQTIVVSGGRVATEIIPNQLP
ncbi:MAG TPA: LPS export ABC transporter periplasmic protein LptC [Crinalium sp.]